MCICTSFGAGGEGVQLPGGNREDRKGGPEKTEKGDQGGREEAWKREMVPWTVFLIANKAVGWGWDGITGSRVRGPSAPDRDYVPGQKRLSGRYAGIKNTTESCTHMFYDRS